MNERYFQSRNEDIIVQELNDEVLVYDLRNNKALCLNKSTALVWKICQSKKSIRQVSDELTIKLKTKVDDDFVWLALKQLETSKLITGNEKLSKKYRGMSRREVIRKVGINSVIALPIISSVVAPVAAQVASCVGTIPPNQPNGTCSGIDAAACLGTCLTQNNCQSCSQRVENFGPRAFFPGGDCVCN